MSLSFFSFSGAVLSFLQLILYVTVGGEVPTAALFDNVLLLHIVAVTVSL